MKIYFTHIYTHIQDKFQVFVIAPSSIQPTQHGVEQSGLEVILLSLELLNRIASEKTEGLLLCAPVSWIRMNGKPSQQRTSDSNHCLFWVCLPSGTVSMIARVLTISLTLHRDPTRRGTIVIPSSQMKKRWLMLRVLGL